MVQQKSPAESELGSLLWPETVAVVGASGNEQRIGGRVYGQTRRGFTGRVYPVNPGSPEVQGDRAYARLADLPERPELVFLAVAASQVLTAAGEAIEAGARCLVILSAGFAETGPEGLRAQQELMDRARQAGVRVLGPNCVGVINTRNRLFGTFVPVADFYRSGRVAIVAQSGAVGARLFAQAQHQGIGVSYLLTGGNEADVDVADLLDLVTADIEIDVVLVHLEGLRNGRRWHEAALRALRSGTKVVAFKAGRGRRAAAAAASHTGVLAVDDRVLDAAFAQAGVLRVADPLQLVDIAGGLAVTPPVGPRVAILSASGGIGVMLTDEAERLGLQIPETSPELAMALGRRIPAYGSVMNPIDYTGQVVNDARLLRDVITEVVASKEFDAVVLGGIPPSQIDAARSFLPWIAAEHGVPILVWADEASVPLLVEAGVPAFRHPFSPVLAVSHGINQIRAIDRAPEIAMAMSPVDDWSEPVTLVEDQTLPLLESIGVPVIPSWQVHTTAQAAERFHETDGAVVLKLSAGWLPHKSEAGAVRLNLVSAAAVDEAFAALDDLRRFGPGDGVILMQPMHSGTRVELMVGATRHPDFGPVLTVGLGGRLVEIVDRVATVLATGTTADFADAVRSLCDGRLVGHHRGLSEAEADSVVAVMDAMAALMRTDPGVIECEINPLAVGEDGSLVALDALLRRTDSQTCAPPTLLPPTLTPPKPPVP
ncbi:acetate--CoA ligase family protein [Nakamurella lactea]|uniref:acetate--CoA ligase family protein n=1 Tax=Nakamurella lactea TaxID=459515 RepID=UPI000416DCB0|nr:acetate--CoA ligase family protein [Nakamurella lactea]